MISFIVFALACSAVASPLSKRIQTCSVNPNNGAAPAACNAADPAFTQTESSMFKNIVCQNSGGVQAVKKPFLLVPGTGTTGAQSFQGGYVTLLGPPPGLGFDVCFLAEPQQMLGDAQDTAERIAYAINALATVSGAPVPVAGWSQGNLDIQWVLTFWTSARANTLQFISLAGDFRGTNLLAALSVAPGIVPLSRSILQQESGSNFLKALSKHGGLSAKVPTTSIFSATDEIIQPENNSPTATSFLSGSNVGNIFIQNACPGLLVTHEDELFINFTFQVAKLALNSPEKFATPAQVAAANIPCNLNAAPGADPTLGTKAIADALAAIAVGELGSSGVEPPVRAYAR